MDFSIKTLQNQAKLCKDLLNKKEAEFLENEFETTSDYEFYVSDIENLKLQIEDLNLSLKTLIVVRNRELLDKFEKWYLDKVLKEK